MLPSTPTVALSALLSQLAQYDAPGSPGPESFVGAYVLEVLGTLVFVGILGAIVLAVAADFVDEGAAYIRSEPTTAFVYGLAGYVVSFILLFVLIITIIGILVAFPAVILLAIVGVVGNVVAVVALGGVLLSRGGEATDRWRAFLVGLVVWAVVGSIPVIGGLLNFVVGAMGFGYIVAYALDSRAETDQRLGDVRRRRRSGQGTGMAGGSQVADEWRERLDETDSPSTGTSAHEGGETNGGDDEDRFRNLAALDAEERENRDREESVNPDDGSVVRDAGGSADAEGAPAEEDADGADDANDSNGADDADDSNGADDADDSNGADDADDSRR